MAMHPEPVYTLSSGTLPKQLGHSSQIMPSFILYSAAAIAEIGGCFAFWAWLRLGRSVYWVLPGVISLTVFALLLTRIESLFAGRTFAAYPPNKPEFVGIRLANPNVCT